MKFGILVFPGTWSDRDWHHVITQVLKQEAEYVWHKESGLSQYDCVVVPGGFSYGDYLRTGAIARFSPVMKALEGYAASGKLVIGSCNGFQILCEAGLLPGVLMRNKHLEFRCQWTDLRVESTATPFTNRCKVGQVLHIPISHGEGCYYADEATLRELNANQQVVMRYCEPSGAVTEAANPNGSLENIAGICNKRRNVFGLMPHPERCAEALLGGTDGRFILESIEQAAAAIA